MAHYVHLPVVQEGQMSSYKLNNNCSTSSLRNIHDESAAVKQKLAAKTSAAFALLHSCTLHAVSIKHATGYRRHSAAA